MADLIERDAVIKQIAETQDKVSSGIEDVTFYRAIKIIRNAPAANQWIPCSERLPEDNAEVLISIFRRHVKIGYIEPGDGLRYWVIPGHSVVPLNYIEAWMPIPDAYEPPESE